jgi:hypothetical protein
VLTVAERFFKKPAEPKTGTETVPARVNEVPESKNASLDSLKAELGLFTDQMREMNGRIGDLQAALELAVDQFTKFAALQVEQTALQKQQIATQGQQIAAIAQIVPAMQRYTEALIGGMSNAASTIAMAAQAAAVRSPEPVEAEAPQAPLAERTFLSKVHSTPLKAREGRFHTTITVPREAWDQAGISAADRVEIDRQDGAIVVRKVAEGGVKVKETTSTRVVLQTQKMGDLRIPAAHVLPKPGEIHVRLPH